MSNDLEQSPEDRVIAAALPATPQRKGHAVLAWICIIFLVGVVLWLHAVSGAEAETAPGEGVDVRLMQLQARYLVGAKDFLKAPGEELYAQVKTMNIGRLEQRLRFIVLAGELAGAAEARAQLNQLEAKLNESGEKLSPEQVAILDDLKRLYADYAAERLDAPSVSKDEREQLRRDLGWFGELALAPPDGPDRQARAAVMTAAHRTLFAIFAFLIGLGLLGLLGFVGLVLFVILLFSGKLSRGIQPGVGHGGVYAETFAVWMALFLGLNFAASKFSLPADARWLVTGLASLFSLSALCWPVMRGIPWTQVRWEIGLRAGKQPPLEPMIGIASYAMALPLLAVGVLMTIAILFLQGALHGLGGNGDSFNPVHVPSHPIVEYVARHDWSARIQILLLASVIAPIVEETVFRGVLYRHLREASAGLGLILSVLFSAALVSFIFAVIHPQGLVAVPPLMGLAFAFCLVREWRGTLVPAMIAHGINNGLVMIFLLLAMGD